MNTDCDEQRELIDSLLMTMQDAVFSMTLPERRIVFISDAFERVVGYPVQRFLDAPEFYASIVHPDDLERVMAAMQVCYRDGFVELEHRIIGPDGQVRWLQRQAWMRFDDQRQPVQVNDSARDITDRKRTESQLRESEEAYRLTLSNISDAVFITDDDGVFTFVCPNASVIFGWSQAEIAARNTIQHLLGESLFDPDLLDRKSEIANIERRVTDKGGQLHDLLVTVKRVAIGDGTTLYTCRDVTEHRRTEEQLREHERRLVGILTNIQDVIWAATYPDLQITYLNPAVRTLYGRHEDEFYANSNLWSEVVHRDDQDNMPALHESLFATGTRDAEYRIVRPDGDVRWVRDRTWVVRDAAGQITGLEGIATDITDRKQAEAALRTSEEKYRSLIDSLDAPILVINEQGYYLYGNDVAVAPFGFAPDVMVGKQLSEIFSPEDAATILDDVRRVMRQNHGLTVEQSLAVSGEKRWYQTSIQPVRDDNDQPFAALIYANDITERKLAEQRILAQNQILYQAHDLKALGDLAGNLVFMNKGGARLLDADDPDAFIGKPIGFFHLPEDFERVAQDYMPHAMKTGYWRGENRLKTVSGRLIDVDQTIFPIRDEQGHIIQMATIMSDITARKQSENALRESEARQRAILRGIPDLMFRLNADGVFLDYHVPADASLFTAPENFLNKSLDAGLPPQLAALMSGAIREAVADQDIAEVEYQLDVPDGVRSFEARIVPVQADEVVVMVRDVTERQRAEIALRESEENYRSLVESTDAVIAVFDADGRLRFANELAARQLGRSASSDLIGQNMRDLFPPEIATRQLQQVQRVIATGQGIVSEALSYVGGMERWYRTSIQPVRSADSQVRVALVLASDITEFKAAERAVRQSEEWLRGLVNSQTHYVLRTDLNGYHVYWNGKFEQEFGWIYAQKGVDGGYGLDSICEYHHERTRATVEKCIAQPGQIVRVELDKPRQDGGVRTTLWEFVCLTDEKGAPHEIQCMGIDISDRKAAERALQEANDRLEQRVVERTAELERTKDRLEAIFNHSGDGILLLDVERGIQQTNYTFAETFGMQGDRCLGRKLSEIFHPENGTQIEKAIQEVAETHQMCRIEARAEPENGQHLMFEISIAPVNRSDQAMHNLVCIIRDITERKRLESALTERLAELDRFFTVALDLLCIADQDGRFIKVNKAWESILGYPAAELEGQPFMQFVHPDDVAATLTAMAQLSEQRVVINFTNRYRAHDGSYRTIEWRSHPHGQRVYAAARDVTEREHMEAVLRASEESYRMTVTSITEGLVIQGKDGAIQFANAAAQRILGLDTDEVMGRTSVDPRWRAVREDGSPFPGEEHPAMVTLRTGEPLTGVVMGVHKPDDMLTWILINSAPLIYDAGQIEGVVATFADITDLKAAEAELQARHEEELAMQKYFRALHEITLLLTRTETLDDFYRLAVQQGMQHFGFERMGLLLYDDDGFAVGTYGTDARGHLVAEHHTRMKPDDLTGILAKTLDRAERFAYDEDTALYEDGRHIGNGANAAAALWNGDILGWLTVDNGLRHAPITRLQLEILSLYAVTIGALLARKQAEQQSRTLSQRLEMATRAGGIGIWEWDMANQDLYWDEGMRRMHGLRPDEFDGMQTSTKYVHPDDLEGVLHKVELAFNVSIPFESDHRIVRPSGEVRYVQARAMVLSDSSGQPQRMVGIQLDVTSIKQAEEALRSALAKEKELGELKSRFVSMASHEFRTPLAAILATTETLTIYRDRMNEQQISDRLDRIRQQVNHMKDIMEDVLQLARIQAGRIEYKPEISDLHGLCREIVEEFGNQDAFRGRIQYECPDPPVMLNFDRRLMRHVFSNLIHNALKYSEASQPVYVTLRQDATRITFQVRDTGIGIPPEDIRHLFEPFHRAANVGTISGTGLGLSITRQAVETHQGTITIDSQVNQGTTFTVILPNEAGEDA